MINDLIAVIGDDVGWHDMLAPACDRQRYERYYGVKGHRNCHDNFLEAMSKRNWHNRPVPQPFNLFMNTFVESNGTLRIRDPIYVVLNVVHSLAFHLFLAYVTNHL